MTLGHSILACMLCVGFGVGIGTESLALGVAAFSFTLIHFLRQ